MGFAYSVSASDLNGDGDADVLAANWYWSADQSNYGKIVWYENLGNGQFGFQQVIMTTTVPANSVRAVDLNGDNRPDVLAGYSDYYSESDDDDMVIWYENLGNGQFGSPQVITTSVDALSSVHTADLNGDGDLDVLSASRDDHTIAWYENLGGGRFSAQHVLTTAVDWASSVFASDLDGDGDLDVLSASAGDDKIAWYKNLGNSQFGSQQVITTRVDMPVSVYASDLDGDGDQDVLSATYQGGLVWIENYSSLFEHSPSILSHTPVGLTSAPVHSVQVEFDAAMDARSFAINDDLVTFLGPTGPIEVSGFVWTDATRLEITFVAQSTPGSYSLILGPGIASVRGTYLDQDRDGTPGEAPDDYYEVTFAIAGMAPVVRDDTYSVMENRSLIVIAADGVLANDSVQDGDVLHAELVTPTLHGTLVLHDDGSFDYSPNEDFNREDSFQYRASDGLNDNAVATATITVQTDYPSYNGVRPLNVNDDGYITPLDALLVINELNANGSYKLALDRARPLAIPFLDVNCDGYVSPLDALLVINDLNGGGSGEGESPATIANAAATSWTFAVNSEMYEPGGGDMSDEAGPVGVKVASSGPSTRFLQSLDLLFAKLDQPQATKTREPVVSRRDMPTGDLEEFLDSMRNGVADDHSDLTVGRSRPQAIRIPEAGHS